MFLLCADFAIFPDNTQLGPSFTLAAMDFQDIPGGGGVSFVNLTANELALQFPDIGLEIDLPIPAPWVRLRVGQFAGPYLIEAMDTNGAIVANLSVNFPNTYRNVRLRGAGISLLRLSGGQNEGSVQSLCIPV